MMRKEYKIIFFIGIIISIIGAYLNYDTFKYQTPIMIENNSDKRYLTTDYFSIDKFLLPNTSATTVPIKTLSARLLMEKDEDEKAFLFLKSSLNDNPFLGFTENYLAKYYLKKQNYDSAYYFSGVSLKKMPIKNHYETFISITVQEKNIKKLDSVFSVAKNKNKTERQLYDFYLSNKFNLGSINESFKNEAKYAFENYGGLKFKYFYQTSLIGQDTIGFARLTFEKGTENFKIKKFEEAIKSYKEAVELNPYEYSYLESLGGAYVANQEYNSAINQLKKLRKKFQTTDGKSEYLLGMAYRGLSKIDSSCLYFRLSNQKKYNLAKFRLEENCN